MILVHEKYSCSIQCLHFERSVRERKRSQEVGVTGDEDPPVPIPNTEVKLISVEDTWRVTAWENRAMPAFIFLLSSVGRACGC